MRWFASCLWERQGEEGSRKEINCEARRKEAGAVQWLDRLAWTDRSLRAVRSAEARARGKGPVMGLHFIPSEVKVSRGIDECEQM